MYAVTYKRSFGPEQLKDISEMIDIHHSAFLTSEGDRKIESLRLLKGYAAEFLYQVPHIHKFRLLETERVLSQSVATIPGFDPREASIAFENLAKYAHNLLHQSWRKEFYKLKTYTGFFMHNIRAHLQNPQEIMITMGYVGTDDYTMVLATHHPSPVSLITASRDCYIASQECLILSQIWERVVGEIPDCPLTIREAYDARKGLMGDTTTIVKYLLHQAHQKQHQLRELEENTRRAALQQEEFESHGKQLIENRQMKYSFVPVDRLIDSVDGHGSNTGDITVGLDSSMNLKGSTNRRPNGYNKKLYSISNTTQQQNHAYPLESTASGSQRSPNSGNSLKELEEVYLQSFINKSKEREKEIQRSGSAELNEILENHKRNSNQGETLEKNRSTRTLIQPIQTRSSDLVTMVNVPIDNSPIDGYSLLHDANTTNSTPSTQSSNYHPTRNVISTTSSFRGLKHHQDLPKSASSSSASSSTSSSGTGVSTNGGILGKIKGTWSGKNKYDKIGDYGFEKEYTRKALTKSKIPNDLDIDKIETRGTGILDKSGKPIPSSIPLEQLFQLDREEDGDRISPIPDTVLTKSKAMNSSNNNNNTVELMSLQRLRELEPWACPHCTYVNVSVENICEICSKSKDFVLEL